MPVIVTCRWIVTVFFIIIPFLHPFVQDKGIVFGSFLTILFVFAAINAFQNKEIFTNNKKLFFFLATYIFLVSLSGLNTSFFKNFTQEYAYLIGEMIVFVTMFLVFGKKEHYRRIIFIFILCGTLVSFFGILQHYNINLIPRDQYFYFRITSTFSNPNDLAGYLILILPLSFFMSYETQEKKPRNFYFIASMILYGGI
ncbi:MAG: hypothetical protein HQK84_06530, partial [Nitrospinae bacterium]|nr:hypothetical protein [Nitrospinota bacterium]